MGGEQGGRGDEKGAGWEAGEGVGGGTRRAVPLGARLVPLVICPVNGDRWKTPSIGARGTPPAPTVSSPARTEQANRCRLRLAAPAPPGPLPPLASTDRRIWFKCTGQCHGKHGGGAGDWEERRGNGEAMTVVDCSRHPPQYFPPRGITFSRARVQPEATPDRPYRWAPPGHRPRPRTNCLTMPG